MCVCTPTGQAHRGETPFSSSGLETRLRLQPLGLLPTGFNQDLQPQDQAFPVPALLTSATRWSSAGPVLCILAAALASACWVPIPSLMCPPQVPQILLCPWGRAAPSEDHCPRPATWWVTRDKEEKTRPRTRIPLAPRDGGNRRAMPPAGPHSSLQSLLDPHVVVQEPEESSASQEMRLGPPWSTQQRQTHGSPDIRGDPDTLEIKCQTRTRENKRLADIANPEKKTRALTVSIFKKIQYNTEPINFYLSPSPSQECSSVVRLAWVSASGKYL